PRRPSSVDAAAYTKRLSRQIDDRQSSKSISLRVKVSVVEDPRFGSEYPLILCLIKSLRRLLSLPDHVSQVVLPRICERHDVVLVKVPAARQKQRTRQRRSRHPIDRLSRRLQRNHLARLLKYPKRDYHRNKRRKRSHVVDDERKQKQQVARNYRPV